MRGLKEIQLPWSPSCWVGGKGVVIANHTADDIYWINAAFVPLSDLSDDSRAKYAAMKATAAIMRAMRK